jgi:hypothetical protein
LRKLAGELEQNWKQNWTSSLCHPYHAHQASGCPELFQQNFFRTLDLRNLEYEPGKGENR